MSPRSNDQNAALREHTKAAILAAAARVFARNGFAGARIADIAAGAGVSGGLVHHYFDTKDALFTEVVANVMSSAATLPEAVLAGPGNARERLARLIEMVLQGAAQLPEYYVVSLHAAMSEGTPAEARRLVERGGREGLALMARVVAQAQEEGSARDGDPVALALQFVATAQGCAVHAMFDAGVPPGFPSAEAIMEGLAPKGEVDG